MPTSDWTTAEKKIARRVFDAALQQELAEVMATFKAKAADAKTSDDIWQTRDYLDRIQREIDSKYDYRYSQLAFVFGRLLREKRISEADLTGLSEEKLGVILRIASL